MKKAHRNRSHHENPPTIPSDPTHIAPASHMPSILEAAVEYHRPVHPNRPGGRYKGETLPGIHKAITLLRGVT